MIMFCLCSSLFVVLHQIFFAWALVLRFGWFCIRHSRSCAASELLVCDLWYQVDMFSLAL
ncbi:hypothetical protein AALP_AA6G249300 [Arabis alpina]|uniref:Uncharacterized protein n=1 Tax=Arabis alpina TaxID=50452 RepID=A0A087GRI7_ARAAL|nr:hypothetical protein AALP_AA6G249300 [Arabis alpina]